MDMNLCKELEDPEKININWKGLFNYGKELYKQKKEKEMYIYFNYFMLVKDYLNAEHRSLYIQVLTTLSYLYEKENNENGLKWAYYTINRISKLPDNPKNFQVNRGKIYYNYAKYLNQNNKDLNFALQILIKVNNIQWPNPKNEQAFKDLKEELFSKASDPNEKQNNNYEDTEDCWNFYENNSIDNSEIFDKNKTSKRKATRVLVLSDYEQKKIDIPLLPRYIYWQTHNQLRQIVNNLLSSENVVFAYDDSFYKRDYLLYIIYNFINNKKFQVQPTNSLRHFTSSSSNYSSDNLILIITSKSLYSNSYEINELTIPNELKPFVNSNEVLSELKKHNYIYKGNPFINFGNTCYLNAGLQCILHCNLLSSYYYNDLHKSFLSDINSNKQYKLNLCFEKLIKDCSSSSLKSFVHEFISVETKFQLGSQHDSPEFISDCLNNLGYGISRKNYEYHEVNSENSSTSKWNKLLTKESSIIVDLFYGQLKVSYICKNKACNNKYHLYEEFLLLDLPIPHNSYRFKLFELGYNQKYKDVYIEFGDSSNFDVKYIKQYMKDQLDLEVDVIKITEKDIYLLGDEDIVKFNKFSEIVLYQIKNPQEQKRCYIVECQLLRKKKNFFHCCCENNSYPIVLLDYPTLEFEEDEKNEGNSIVYDDEFKEVFNFNANNNLTHTNIKIKEYFQINLNHIKKLNNKNEIYFTGNLVNFVYKNTNKTKSIDFIQQNSSELTIQSCLYSMKYTKSKIQCKKCKNILRIETTIIRLPHYLLIYFKRFYVENGIFYKKQNFIDFPEQLHVNEEREIDNKCTSITYKAFAMNYHYGNVLSGHYTASCKEGNKWYYFNDKRVSDYIFKADNNAVIVFYEKQGPEV